MILAPDSPTGLVVEATGTDTLSVTWSSQTASSFNVVYSPTDGGNEQTETVGSGTATSTNIGGLTAGTSYTVYVIAVFDGKDSDPSTIKSVYTSKIPKNTRRSVSCWSNVGSALYHLVYYAN